MDLTNMECQSLAEIAVERTNGNSSELYVCVVADFNPCLTTNVRHGRGLLASGMFAVVNILSVTSVSYGCCNPAFVHTDLTTKKR